MIEVKDGENIEKAAVSIATSDVSKTVGDYKGKRAIEEFVGIRKIISVIPHPGDPGAGDEPRHGSELTFSYFNVASPSERDLLVGGQDVTVTYLEDKTA